MLLFCLRRLCRVILLAELIFLYLTPAQAIPQELVQAVGADVTKPLPPMGAPAEMELKTFGALLQADMPGQPLPKGLRSLIFEQLKGMYATLGQFPQVMRLCHYQAARAVSQEERTAAADCLIGAYFGLGRYVEAEQLMLEMRSWRPTNSWGDVSNEGGRWMRLLRLSENAGDIMLAESAARNMISLSAAILALPPLDDARGSNPGIVASRLRQLDAARKAENDVARKAQLERDYQQELLKEKKADFARSLETMRRMSAYELRDEGLAFQARLAYQRQDFTLFERQVRELLAAKKAWGDTYWTSTATNFIPMLQVAGRTAYALELAENGLKSLRIGAGISDSHHPVNALDDYPEVIKVLGDDTVSSEHITALIRLARAYSVLERNADAQEVLVSAYKRSQRNLSEPAEASTLMSMVENEMAIFASKRGMDAEAMSLWRSARLRLIASQALERSDELGRIRLPIDSLLLEVSARLLKSIAETVPQPVSDLQQKDEILTILQTFSASRFGQGVLHAARRSSADNVVVQRLLDREGALLHNLISIKSALAKVSMDQKKNGKESEWLQEDLASVMSELKDLKRDLNKIAVANGQAIANVGTVSWDRLVPALAVSDAYWQWVLHPAGNMIVCISTEGIRLEIISQSLAALRKASIGLSAANNLKNIWYAEQIPSFPMGTAEQLHTALFGNVASNIVGKTRWILAPPAVFDRLPWSALRVANCRPSTAGCWLVEKVAITIAPSILAWASLSERAPTNAKNLFLGIGDPVGSSSFTRQELNGMREFQLRGSTTVKETFQSDTTSTAFAKELKALANMFPSRLRRLLLGPQASKQKLMALPLQNYRILVFSTHGYLGGEISEALGPSLLLSRGSGPPRESFLSATEVYELHLDADLVYLSACDTSGSDGTIDAEGFSGLTSAFLYAGSRTVVASLWPVESRATETLTVRAMRSYLNAGARVPFAFALRDAMLQSLHDKDVRLRHPSMWAAFISVGR
jgi:CHAT domain-containing protein